MTEKIFKRLDYAFGWLTFLVAAIVYLLTIEPTVSFWDCGEFIASSYKVQVGHPPGAPFFMLIARLFSMFASSPEHVAMLVNSFSAIVSAFTIMFLYWSVAFFARRLIAPDNKYTVGKTIAIIGASLVGALAYTFSDTFWFSAVEGEVYAFSSFFTAIVFWAILKWCDCKDDNRSYRWIFLICLLMGMSIGVHLLNLLTIPAIAFVVYFKKFRSTVLGFFATLGVSLVILAVIMWGIIPGVAIVASNLELFFVNTLGMPFNAGVIIWCVLVVALLAASIYTTQYTDNKVLNYIFPSLALTLIGTPFFTGNAIINVLLLGATVALVIFLAQKKRKLLNAIMVCVTMLILGYSSYAVLVIRSNANPPMNQNNPSDVFGLLYYLNREQYGDRPLLYGPYYDAKYIDEEAGSPIYVKRGDKYEVVDYKQVLKYNKSRCTFFPRMFSKDERHIAVYKEYGDIRRSKPTFANNIKFFVSYQLHWMYWRYFMWNFAGRQNDIQGDGNLLHGNWKSGLSFIDTPRLGDQDKLPDYLKNNKANNKYYMLPLLLGLLGLVYQLFKHLRDWWIVLLLFVLTGIAIVVYLNQTPEQPRERDYAYAGSFYAFALWIGLGVVAVYNLFRKFMPTIVAGIIATLICLPVPALMASENWDDHDRSNRYVARDFAKNYLNSCAPNAILFTFGDNDTFPIWYAQEVEGIRTDVKVCCLPYFASDWYVDQMKCQTYDAEPMPLTLTRDQYEPSVRDVTYYYQTSKNKTEDNTYISVDSLMSAVTNDRLSAFPFQKEDVTVYQYTYNKNKLFLPVDSATVVDNHIVDIKDADKIEKVVKFNMNRQHIVKNELMTLDLLRTNKWKRPIYFTSFGSSNTLGLDNYFQNEGFAYKLVPIKSPTRKARINTDILYDNMMNKFVWGNLNDPDIIADNTINRTVKVVRVRENFCELAIQLAREGKIDSAKNVIARCESVMPTDIFPPMLYDVCLADAYYAVDDTTNGDRSLQQIFDVAKQEIAFFNSLTKRQLPQVYNEYYRTVGTMQYVVQTANKHGRTSFIERVYPEYQLSVDDFEKRLGAVR